MDEDHVWAVLEEQGHMVKWLARVTDIPAQRLHDIRHRRSWWRDAEVATADNGTALPLAHERQSHLILLADGAAPPRPRPHPWR